ncbi:MAG TPA: hypothetical protein VGI39_18515 [Polyangiaceae bacterium]
MDVPPSKRPALAPLTPTILKFVAAWLLFGALSIPHGPFDTLDALIRSSILNPLFVGYPLVHEQVERFYEATLGIPALTFAATLLFGTGLAALGALVRMVARARLRAGKADLLDRPRAWTRAHPDATRALLALPVVGWLTFLFTHISWDVSAARWLLGFARAFPALAISSWGMFAMSRKGLRSLLAPTIGSEEEASGFDLGREEIVFDAVAVTRETLAIVSIFAAVMLAVPALLCTRAFLDLFSSSGSLWSFVAAYVGLAGAGAYAFRQASRVSVGVDGVHIRGTSRARFFAYRDLDGARADGSDIVLIREGKLVLRLQLHGEDARKREAVVARVAAHIEQVREGHQATAAQLVTSASERDLVRAASGAGDYRAAALTREQLWSLVEGPEIGAEERSAAAMALVRAGGEAERARLRVAAEQCAEPRVRVALGAIAEDAEESVEAGRPAQEGVIGRQRKMVSR